MLSGRNVSFKRKGSSWGTTQGNFITVLIFVRARGSKKTKNACTSFSFHTDTKKLLSRWLFSQWRGPAATRLWLLVHSSVPRVSILLAVECIVSHCQVLNGNKKNYCNSNLISWFFCNGTSGLIPVGRVGFVHRVASHGRKKHVDLQCHFFFLWGCRELCLKTYPLFLQ